MSNEYTEFFDSFQQPKPKYNSTEEIRIALGLKPWDEFAIESIQWWLADKHTDNTQKLQYIYSKRRTGQTTKMLVEAVYASQFKVVTIAGCKRHHTHFLVDDARQICEKLGLELTNIQPVKHGFEFSADFTDHYRRNE